MSLLRTREVFEREEASRPAPFAVAASGSRSRARRPPWRPARPAGMDDRRPSRTPPCSQIGTPHGARMPTVGVTVVPKWYLFERNVMAQSDQETSQARVNAAIISAQTS